MDNAMPYKKFSQLPANLQQEVMDFIDFLLKRSKGQKNKPKPEFGSGKGMFVMKEDFDVPLDDFNEYMS